MSCVSQVLHFEFGCKWLGWKVFRKWVVGKWFGRVGSVQNGKFPRAFVEWGEMGVKFNSQKSTGPMEVKVYGDEVGVGRC